MKDILIEDMIMNPLVRDIIQTADNFVQSLPESHRKDFDYSVHSLAEVDDFLEWISDSLSGDDDIYNMSSSVGCYVFETARRNYGGEYYWIKKEEQPILVAGEPDFAVTIRAWEKVRGRIVNGKEDSIPFYIAGYAEHIAIGKEKKGYYATIV